MLLCTYSFSRLIELTLYRSMGRSQSNHVSIGKEPFPCSDVQGMLETPEIIGVLEVLEMAERLNIINTIKNCQMVEQSTILLQRGEIIKKQKIFPLAHQTLYETFIKRMLISYCLLFLISRQSCDDVREQFGVEAQ